MANEPPIGQVDDSPHSLLCARPRSRARAGGRVRCARAHAAGHTSGSECIERRELCIGILRRVRPVRDAKVFGRPLHRCDSNVCSILSAHVLRHCWRTLLHTTFGRHSASRSPTGRRVLKYSKERSAPPHETQQQNYDARTTYNLSPAWPTAPLRAADARRAQSARVAVLVVGQGAGGGGGK